MPDEPWPPANSPWRSWVTIASAVASLCIGIHWEFGYSKTQIFCRATDLTIVEKKRRALSRTMRPIIVHKQTICKIMAWVIDGASGDGRSVTCIWFQCFRRAESCFLSPFRTALCAIHVQVTDRRSPDAPSLTHAIIVQMVYSQRRRTSSQLFGVWFTAERRICPLVRCGLSVFHQSLDVEKLRAWGRFSAAWALPWKTRR